MYVYIYTCLQIYLYRYICQISTYFCIYIYPGSNICTRLLRGQCERNRTLPSVPRGRSAISCLGFLRLHVYTYTDIWLSLSVYLVDIHTYIYSYMNIHMYVYEFIYMCI